MTYRISTAVFFIFVAAVLIAWYQGFRIYPRTSAVPATEENEGISINDARKISTLKLDFTLFDDPLYKSLTLREFKIPDVSAIPRGRTNPFVPLGPQGGTR